MKEYKFKYESSPISEVVKIKVIEAARIDLALQDFISNTKNVTEILSIELI